MELKSWILKLSLFATGLSGIVAEYVLSTLATYFLGDSVFQWTMIVSIMLFSMGLGSRMTKYMEKNLLERFVMIEFTLSILTAFVSLFAYMAATYSIYTGVIIYSMSITVGLLIGMEIPLVIRINDQFEMLKVNVSSILENDYYGSLLGGVFFAFLGLPFLGLTYTPFVLGAINFSVAMLLFYILWNRLDESVKRRLGSFAVFVMLLLTSGVLMAERIISHGESVRYKDRVIYSEVSPYQKIVMTQSGSDYWLYINGNQQLSTVDEEMYHEPLVHPLLRLHPNPTRVLILGGGDGCAAREVLKYEKVQQVTLVDLDPLITNLAITHPVLTSINNNALSDPKVHVINEDAFTYMEHNQDYFDIIIIDMPDPKSVELGRLYAFEFYRFCERALRPHGMIVTQAGSPYFANRAFRCIEKTLSEAGFNTVPIHNQIITLGEWGWILGIKGMDSKDFLQHLRNLDFQGIDTHWINREAMTLMTSFGKAFDPDAFKEVETNTIHNPVLFKYYLKGSWDLY